MDYIEIKKYQALRDNYTQKLISLNKSAVLENITWEECDRLESHYNNIFKHNVLRIFNRLTWEDQIKFCLLVNDEYLIGKMDAEQQAAMRIMQ